MIVFSEYLQLFAYYFLGYCFSSQICTWGDSVPNGSLKRSIPVWCDFHGDSDMVPWRHPFSGRMWTDLTTELTHFNLVIRLRKAKQLAFSFISLVCNILQTLLSQCLLETSLLPGFSRAEQSETPFFAAAMVFDVKHDMSYWRQQACPLPAGMVFLVSGEVEHILHLIRWNLNSCLCLRGLTWQRSRPGVTHDSLGKKWIRSNCR